MSLLAVGLALLAAPNVVAGASLRTEAAAGSAPVYPGTPSEASLSSTVLPAVGLYATTPRLNLGLEAGSRIYFRYPTPGDVERPLLLGTGAATQSYQIDPSLQWRSTARVLYGEVDYTTSQVALQPGTGTRLSAPVLDFFTAGGLTGFEWRIDRRQSITLDAVIDHTRPLNTQQGAFRNTTSTGGDGSYRWALTRRSALITPIQGRYYFVVGAPDLTSFSVGEQYHHQLDEKNSIDVMAGLTSYLVFGESRALLPRAFFTWQRAEQRARRAKLSNIVTARLDSVFDPTAGILREVLGLDAVARIEGLRRLRFEFSLGAYTQVGRPVPAPTVATTTLAMGAAVTRALGKQMDLTVGARYGTRASHFAVEHFQIIDRQAWLYAAWSVAFGMGSGPAIAQRGREVR